MEVLQGLDYSQGFPSCHIIVTLWLRERLAKISDDAIHLSLPLRQNGTDSEITGVSVDHEESFLFEIANDEGAQELLVQLLKGLLTIFRPFVGPASFCKLMQRLGNCREARYKSAITHA